MPILSNPRHEKFAELLAEGKTAREAYNLSGYRDNRHNAARLKSSEHIAARVLEIQGVAAKSAEISVASLLDELEHARQRADSLGQLSASVRAISEKARLAGLVVEQQRIEVVNADPYDEATSAEEVLIKITGELGIEIAVGLAQLFKLHYDEAAIRCMAANAASAGNGQQAIEWRPNRSGRKREIG